MGKKSSLELAKEKALIKKRAKLLKANNILNIDLRKQISRQKATAINKKWAEWGKFFNTDNFVKRTVSAKTAKVLKKSGYKTIKNKVFIQTEGYQSQQIKIRNNEIIYHTGEKTIRVLPLKGNDIIRELERRHAEKLPKHTYITVRIGDNSRFGVSFPKIGELLDYMTAWQPKDKEPGPEREKLKNELINQMSIVTFNLERKPSEKIAKKKNSTHRRNH